MFWFIPAPEQGMQHGRNRRIPASGVRSGASGRVKILRSATRRHPISAPARFRDLHPTTDGRYVSAPRTGRWKIMRSIDSLVAPADIVAKYKDVLWGTPETYVARGSVQRRLFVAESVHAGCVLIEYTGNRVEAVDVAKFDHAGDRFAILSDIQVTVPSDWICD